MAKDTADLEHDLQKAKSFDDFRAENQGNQREKLTLAEYLAQLLREKKLNRAEVIAKSYLEKVYAYHIFAGRKVKTSRSKILSLAVAMGLTPKEAQHLLYYAGLEQLYVRNSWDSVIWYALENHLTVPETNELLNNLSEKPFLGRMDN